MDDQTSQSIALQALVWILSDDDRAMRLLSVTGITPDDMRTAINEPWLLGAALSYLEGYEPDLIKCCQDIAIEPEHLVRASRMLNQDDYNDF